MKNSKFVALMGILVLGIMFFLNSCTEDPCENVLCLNGGTCDEGICDCPPGFSGDGCEIEDLCFTQNVTCLNGGTCVNGVCDCAEGYSGDSCENVDRDNLLAQGGAATTWSVDDSCSSSGGATYSVDISASGSNPIGVLITNVWDTFLQPVVATVDGDVVTIANQEPDDDDFTVEGTGTISADGSTITWTYTIEDISNNNTDVCSSTWSKR